VLLAAVCTLNCLFLYAWEHPAPRSQAHWTTRWATGHLPVLTLAIASAAGLIAALAAAAFLCFVPNVMYYANGGSQFGMRHALDFEPFLFALMVMAVATKRAPQLLVDILCAISIAVGVWGIWFWRTFYDRMLNHLLPGVNS